MAFGLTEIAEIMELLTVVQISVENYMLVFFKIGKRIKGPFHLLNWFLQCSIFLFFFQNLKTCTGNSVSCYRERFVQGTELCSDTVMHLESWTELLRCSFYGWQHMLTPCASTTWRWFRADLGLQKHRRGVFWIKFLIKIKTVSWNSCTVPLRIVLFSDE